LTSQNSQASFDQLVKQPAKPFRRAASFGVSWKSAGVQRNDRGI